MQERFFRYSIQRARRIRVMVTDAQGRIRCLTAAILSFDEQTVTFLTAGRKTPQTLPREAFLSASYARGDSGELCDINELSDVTKEG